ncbi:MAG: hypothetical protein QM538_05480 [Methylacidiphilales bacterium]|nr:hypothetical protein [Candidatus Methylacidiphilales bacterium]
MPIIIISNLYLQLRAFLQNKVKYFSILLVGCTIGYGIFLITKGNHYPLAFLKPLMKWSGESLFGDIKQIKTIPLLIEEGLDPYVVPQGTLNIPLAYPPIWIWIAQTFQLQIDLHFYTFVSIYIVSYIAILLYFMMKSNTIWYLLLFFSTPSLLGIDRGSNDILVFDILFLIAMILRSKNIYAQWLAGIPLLFAGAIKIFPFAGILAFRNIILALILLACAGLYLYFNLEYLHYVMTYTQIIDFPRLSYGALLLFPNINGLVKVLLLGTLLAIVPLILLYLNKNKSALLTIIETQNSHLSFNQLLYVLGASCYCLSFFSHTNWDYRLIMLFLCFPLLLQHKNHIVIQSILIFHLLVFYTGVIQLGLLNQILKFLIWYFHAIILLKHIYSNFTPLKFDLKKVKL